MTDTKVDHPIIVGPHAYEYGFNVRFAGWDRRKETTYQYYYQSYLRIQE